MVIIFSWDCKTQELIPCQLEIRWDWCWAAMALMVKLILLPQEMEILEQRGDRTVLAHNVDVICEADLKSLVADHEATQALATLAMQARDTQRYLLFDDDGLFGRENRKTGERTEVRAPRGEVRPLAFAGVHACAPRFFELVTERGVFPIVEVWLRLAGLGHAIRPWIVPEGAWLEIGNPERLAAVRERFEGTR